MDIISMNDPIVDPNIITISDDENDLPKISYLGGNYILGDTIDLCDSSDNEEETYEQDSENASNSEFDYKLMPTSENHSEMVKSDCNNSSNEEKNSDDEKVKVEPEKGQDEESPSSTVEGDPNDP